MSIKECGHHEAERRHVLRLILIGGTSFLVVILLTILLIFLILRPTKPHVILQDATLYSFNLSSATPNTLSLTMQVTLSSHNPNARIGVYYQHLRLHAAYRSQQISLPTALPDAYQGHHDFTLWSPFLYAAAVPVAPFLLEALRQDQRAAALMLNVRLTGALKWKVGSWVSGRYHLYVNCPAFISLDGDRATAVGVVAAPLKLQLLQSCSVDV
ncbi:NDR1/HIN1-like protein 1 [Cajanus cajan]|nr:NDR1/HIN1-like protein 1 [Cajanus cajan]